MTTTKIREELIGSIESSKQVNQERLDRINDHYTDFEDCSVSFKLTENSITHKKNELRSESKKHIFHRIVLWDVEKNEIASSQVIQSQYGTAFVVDGKFISQFPKRRQTHLKKGYVLKDVSFTCDSFAKREYMSGASGMFAAYTSSSSIYPTSENFQDWEILEINDTLYESESTFFYERLEKGECFMSVKSKFININKYWIDKLDEFKL